MNIDSLRYRVRRSAALFLGLSCLTATSFAQRSALRVQVPTLPAGAVDQGAVSQTATEQFTLYLQPTADRVAALKQYLSAVQTSADPAYHVWLTPAQFGQEFGASQEQLERVNTWASANGLTVSVSASRSSALLTGKVAQLEAALAPAMHSVQIAGTNYVANTAVPSVPAALSSDVSAIAGLSTLPSAHPVTFAATSGTVVADDALGALATLVDANASRVISMTSSVCVEDLDAATQSAMQLTLQQASVQGMTLLASSGCGARGSASFPAALSEVTAVALKPGISVPTTSTLTELRPSWQTAPGLPADAFRHEPDVTTTDIAAFVKTMNSILAKMPTAADGTLARLGNINATLYSLGPMPGLYTQPDHVAAGTWEAATGLGLVDLDKLAQFFPLGSLATDVSISLDSYFVTHGSNVTFISVVKDISGQGNGAVPTGTVTFNLTPGGTLGPVTLNNGTATFTTNTLAGGTYSVTASYSGDSTYAAKTGAVTDTFTIGPENATVTASAVAAVPIGSSATLTVTVKSPSGVGTPTGKVTVIPSGTSDTNTYTGTLSGTGGTAVAQVLVPGVQAGNDVFLVSCDGSDPSFSCPTQRITASFLKATPAVTLTYSPTSPNSGDTVNFQATVVGAGNNAAAPTGNVNFLNNGAVFGAGTVSGGVASLTTNAYAWSASGNTFSASYGGDNNYNSNSSTTTTTSGTVATTTVVSATPNNVPVGGQVTVTATVSPNQTSANSVGGTVSFVAGSLAICTGAVTNGIATCSGSLSTRGAYNITANYNGDAHFAASSTGSQSASVEVVSGSTATTISASPSAPTAGQSVTFTATVKNTNGSAAAFPLTGNVAFYVNGSAVTSVTLTNGQATYTTTLGSSAESVYAVYSGDGNWTGSTSSTLSYNSGSTSGGSSSSGTTLTSNTTFALVGTNVVLTATISQGSGSTSGSPLTGSVTFYDLYNGQSTALATISVSSNGPGAGYAQTSTTGLKRGTHAVTAVYSGNSSYGTSTSAPVSIYITDADVTFSPASLSLVAGTSASSTATVTAYAGFTGTVGLSCTPPSGTSITCSFNPATITSSGTSTLTVTTAAQHAENKPFMMRGVAGGVAFAGLLMCFCLPGLRKCRPALLTVMVSLGLLGTVGCTNIINGNGSHITSGTPSGTQYLTITATVSDGNTTATHTQQFAVTVQ